MMMVFPDTRRRCRVSLRKKVRGTMGQERRSERRSDITDGVGGDPTREEALWQSENRGGAGGDSARGGVGGAPTREATCVTIPQKKRREWRSEMRGDVDSGATRDAVRVKM